MVLKHLLTAAVLGLGAIAAVPASAMPLDPLPAIATTKVHQVRWVCSSEACWEQPEVFYGGDGYGYGRRHRFEGAFEGRREGRFEGRRERQFGHREGRFEHREGGFEGRRDYR